VWTEVSCDSHPHSHVEPGGPHHSLVFIAGRWAEMAKTLKGRSERDIKNNWNSMQRQSRPVKSRSHPTTDAATILRPSGAPIPPPGFSLDPIERPRTLRTPLSVDTRELDVADTLSQSFACRDENRDIFPHQTTLSPSWTTPQNDANSPRDSCFDDFKALEFCARNGAEFLQIWCAPDCLYPSSCRT